VALCAAQITVATVSRRSWTREVLPQWLWEQVLSTLLLIALPVLDGLLLFGVVGHGWPIAATTSLELLVAALAAALIDDVVVLAGHRPSLPLRYVMIVPEPELQERLERSRSRRRAQIVLRIMAICALAAAELKLSWHI